MHCSRCWGQTCRQKRIPLLTDISREQERRLFLYAGLADVCAGGGHRFLDRLVRTDLSADVRTRRRAEGHRAVSHAHVWAEGMTGAKALGGKPAWCTAETEGDFENVFFFLTEIKLNLFHLLISKYQKWKCKATFPSWALLTGYAPCVWLEPKHLHWLSNVILADTRWQRGCVYPLETKN